MNSSGNDNKKKIYVGMGIIILLLIGVIVLMFLNSPEKVTEPLVETPTIEEPNTTPVVEDEEPEVEQKDAVSLYKVKVLSVSDLSTKYLFNVQIGLSGTLSETTVEANTSTVFLDLKTLKTVSPSEIKEGTTMLLYGSGSYNSGLMKAQMICLGDDTSYTYGMVRDKEGSPELGYTFTLYNTMDKVKMNKDTVIRSGYLGTSIPSPSIIQNNSKLLYKYDPTFEITSSGNVYTCTEVIVIATE